MSDFDTLMRLGVSLAIGLLVGLERGWQTREETDSRRAAGLRTFGLAGLLGGISAAVGAGSQILIGLAFLGYAGSFVAFQMLEARVERRFSATTTIAGLTTFMLGAYAMVGTLTVAVAAAVAMALLLALREPLHRWVAALTWAEVRAVLTLATMTFLALPLLPNRPVDPWAALNPTEIWVLAIVLAGISFGGYMAVRIFGDRLGIAMAGLAGGLASSTATTVTLARLAKAHPGAAGVVTGGILLSGLVMILRVGVLAFAINPALALPILPGLAALALVHLGAGLAFLSAGGDAAAPTLRIANPLDLTETFRFALFITAIMFSATVVSSSVGRDALLVLAAVSGLADVDAITVSSARLSLRSLPVSDAGLAIAIAVASNTAVKAIMAATTGGRAVGLRVGLAMGLALAAMALVLWSGVTVDIPLPADVPAPPAAP